ncbi:MAG: radical SAM protein, partial [Chloroflexota bacterium]
MATLPPNNKVGHKSDPNSVGRIVALENEDERVCANGASKPVSLAELEPVPAFAELSPEEFKRKFLSIYKPVSILPPDQYMTLVLQATEGCSHNRCTFCSFYRDRHFRIKTLPEFRRHVAQVKEFMGPAMRMRRTIFLADANAIVIPEQLLVSMLDVVNASFEITPAGENAVLYKLSHPEAFDGVYAFVDAFTTRYKTVDDFSKLAMRNLRRVYIGMETGNDQLLQWVCKAGTSADAIDAVRRIKGGGVSVGVIVMIGIGGRRFAQQHVSDTVRAVNSMGLDQDDVVYFSEFIDSVGSDYSRIAARDGVEPLTHEEMRVQTESIRAGLSFPG